MAPGVPGCSPIDSLGQQSTFDAERLERPNLFRLGRQPRQVGMLEHVIEREEAPHEHFRRGDPAAADVFGAESPVDVAPVDPTHAADAGDAAHVLFGGHALCDEGMDGAPHLLGVTTQEPRPLRPGEDATVEAGQGDPFGPASCPAETLKRVLASPEMGDHRSSGSRALALGAHSERRDLEEQPLPERVAVRVRWRMRGSYSSHSSVPGLGTGGIGGAPDAHAVAGADRGRGHPVQDREGVPAS